MMLQVQLTELMLNEIIYKMDIVENEPDLCESYDVTDIEVEALTAHLRKQKPGLVDLPAKHCDMMAEELDNCCEIAHDNLLFGDINWLSYLRSMKLAIKRIREAQQLVVA